MKRVLLISNCTFDQPGGRAEKFRARRRFLVDRGWDVTLAHIPHPFDFRSAKSMRAIAKCLRMARREYIDIVNSVSEPPQLHFTGYLASRAAGVPWLMEFRDPYATNPHVDPKSFNGRLRRRVEPFFVQRADKIIWDDGIQLPDDYFADNYPDVPADRWTKLPHLGFEREKFDNATECSFDSFTITYAGSFYEGWIEPYSVLEGLSKFADRHSELNIDLRFYGDWKPEYDTAAEQAGVSGLISTYDWVDYDELLPILKGSDAVLYIGGNDTSNELNIPSKMYDYVGAATPILAIVDTSFRAAEFVVDNNLGIVAPPTKTDAIASAFEHLYRGDVDYDRTEANRFSRTRKMDALADVLDGMVED